jgi:hypothetical protein
MWTRQASMRMAMLWQLVENHELGALHFKKYILERLGGILHCSQHTANIIKRLQLLQ